MCDRTRRQIDDHDEQIMNDINLAEEIAAITGRDGRAAEALSFYLSALAEDTQYDRESLRGTISARSNLPSSTLTLIKRLSSCICGRSADSSTAPKPQPVLLRESCAQTPNHLTVSRGSQGLPPDPRPDTQSP
ncbi:MAG: hypothetical protein ACREAC_31830 [Blastocatellia bacterium]